MDKNIELTNLQNHGAPLPYVFAVVSQPGAHNQGYSNPDFVLLPQSEVHLPAGCTAGGPGSFFPAPNILVGPGYHRNVLEEVLPAHQTFTFHQSQKIGFGNNSIICQIRGAENQLVMSTLMTTTTTGRHNGNEDQHHSSTTIRFSDPTGNVLITSQQTGQEQTILSGDRILRLIDGAAVAFCCSQQMIGQNSNGEVVFQVVEQGSDFNFVANGATVAVAKKTGKLFGLEFIAPVDANSKAMIIAGSYHLFVLFHAESSCGCNGSVNLSRGLCVIPLVFFLVTALIPIVMIVIFREKIWSFAHLK